MNRKPSERLQRAIEQAERGEFIVFETIEEMRAAIYSPDEQSKLVQQGDYLTQEEVEQGLRELILVCRLPDGSYDISFRDVRLSLDSTVALDLYRQLGQLLT